MGGMLLRLSHDP